MRVVKGNAGDEGAGEDTREIPSVGSKKIKYTGEF